MAKTLNTRIQLKYDSYINWDTNNPILLKGELALVEVPADTNSGFNEPSFLMKIGDGTKRFKELDWVSAKAADVVQSLKGTNPTLPAESITGLTEFIENLITAEDTQYKVVKDGDMGFKLQKKGKDDPDFIDQDVIQLTAPTYSLIEGDENGTVKFGITGSEQTVSVHGLGSAAYTEADDYDAAGTASGLIAGLTSEGATAAAGEVISQVTQANGIITVTKKTLTEADIPALSTAKVTGLDAALAGKQDTISFNSPYNAETNKAATMQDVTTAIEGLSGAMHYVGESTTDPAEGTVTIEEEPEYTAKSGDVVTYQSKEYVYDGKTWRLLGDESSYAVKGSIKDSDIAPDANIAQSKIAGLETALAEKATPAQITSAIDALDKADEAIANQFVTAVSQENGIITVTRKQPEIADVNGLQAALDLKANDDDLATVAKTGKIDDLEQTNTIILYCGTSSEVM